MKRFFAITVICISFFACKPGIPKGIIQPDQMEKVLFDIHVVDGYIGTIGKIDTAKIIASSYYKGVYKKFDIDSATYTKSLNYYYDHPDLLNKIYENLSKTFEKEKAKNTKRIDDAAQALQNKMLASRMRPLDVSLISKTMPEFTFKANPFTLDPTYIQVLPVQ
jgi:hypothetical protein